MTNPAAAIGLTFDGTDIQENPWGIFLEIVHGLNEPPQVRGVDTVIPSAVGRRSRNRVADKRILELVGFVAGIGADEAAQRADFRDQWTTFLALFDPTADPAELAATLENGDATTITARTTSIVVGQQVPSMVSVSVELESVDPYWSHETGGS